MAPAGSPAPAPASSAPPPASPTLSVASDVAVEGILKPVPLSVLGLAVDHSETPLSPPAFPEGTPTGPNSPYAILESLRALS